MLLCSLMIAVRIALSLLLLLLFNGVVAAVISNNSNVATKECGKPSTLSPVSVAMSFDGSAAGVTLAQAWAASYKRVCLANANTTTFQITSSSSARAAKRLCATNLDVAILSRPFLSEEATAITVGEKSNYHFQCSKGYTSRTILQAHVAMNAFVLVTAPQGIASYCINQFFNEGLSMQQLRALYSNYGLARVFNISTLSPSMPPTVSASPTASTPQPIFGPVPTTPTRRPFLPVRSRLPTLPPATRSTIFWGSPGFRPRAAIPAKDLFQAEPPIDCSKEQAMVAGPPVTVDMYQDFAGTILSEYAQGERMTPRYFPLPNVDATIRFLLNNTNAIALVSLPDYRANQGRLAAVNIIDSQGTNQIPSTMAIQSRQYPLAFNVYMAIVDSSNNTQTKFVRSLLLYGYSTSDDDTDVARSGLVPLPSVTKDVWMKRLS